MDQNDGDSLITSALRREGLAGLVQNGSLDAEEWVAMLISTYPSYLDRDSRIAIYDVSTALNSKDDQFMSLMAAQIHKEVSVERTMAMSSNFVLLEWTSHLLILLSKSGVNEHLPLLVSSQGLLVDKLARRYVKKSLRTAALRMVRRCLRIAFKNNMEFVEVYASTLCRGPVGNALLLDQVALVIRRQLSGDQHAQLFRKYVPDICNFYAKELVGTRSVLPDHLRSALSNFFSNFVDQDIISKSIFPAFEKALLRSPEAVLDGNIFSISADPGPLVSFVKALPMSFDLSDILYTQLLKPILMAIKSSNRRCREGLQHAFSAILSCCRNEEIVKEILDTITSPVLSASITAPDQRIIYYKLLGDFTPSVPLRVEICNSLVSLLAKETSEMASLALIEISCKLISEYLMEDVAVSECMLQAIRKGMNDKRINVRLAWLQQLSQPLYEVKSKKRSKPILDIVKSPILRGFTEVSESPLQSQNLICGFLAVALFPERDLLQIVLTATPKPSFLLWDRAYSKLPFSSLVWAARALAECMPNLTDTTSLASDLWAKSFLHLIANPKRLVRQATWPYFETVARKHPQLISTLLLQPLWGVLQVPNSFHPQSFSRVITTLISLVPDPQSLLVQYAVLAHAQEIGADWIKLCQSTSLDPAEICSRHSEAFVSEIAMYSDGNSASTQQMQAAYRASAQLAFVSPQSIVPQLNKLLAEDLNPDELQWIGEVEAGIWRTAKDQTFVNVVNNTPHINGDVKRDATLQWESEIREQIAKAKPQQKKWSKEQQENFNVQLQKEEKVRTRLSPLINRVHRAFGIISALSHGVSNGADSWLPSVVNLLLNETVRRVSKLLGIPLAKCFLACSSQLRQSLGHWRLLIIVAILRAFGLNAGLEYEDEPLNSLVTRVSYRLRSYSDNNKLDAVSMSLLLPLLQIVLERHGISVKGSEADEQVLLALEIMSLQNDAITNMNTSKVPLLNVFFVAMEQNLPSQKSFKDCLVCLMQSMGEKLNSEEKSVLVAALLSPEITVRSSVLQVIEESVDVDETDDFENIWVLIFDEYKQIADGAASVWQENDLDVAKIEVSKLLSHLDCEDQILRTATAKSVAGFVQSHANNFDKIYEILCKKYKHKALPLLPEYDDYGMVKKESIHSKDPWESRSGIVLAFHHLATIFPGNKVPDFISFLINSGCLSDKKPAVRSEALAAGIAVISAHGKPQIGELTQILEKLLDLPDKGSQTDDHMRVAVIVLYGTLAQHLVESDPKLPVIVDRLIAALSTPSETVQMAVAERISPLIILLRHRSQIVVEELLKLLLDSPKYAVRRGAAYGLAGVVSGLGIKSLLDLEIMDKLEEAVKDKKSHSRREGALFAFEIVSKFEGRLFEPYILVVLPLLLSTLGDPNVGVREASGDVARTFMTTISGYGVKRILPTLLQGLDDNQWRSKKGSAELLGSMAYLAPRQLSLFLPTVIPRLTDILSDTHKEVRAAGSRSLSEFGEVIKNPEIQSLVSTLLNAMTDPTKYTEVALNSLLKTSYVHYIDAPSLALVMYVLQRAMKDRSAATKRKAAQIVGNMASLTDSRDLIPYLSTLIVQLKVCLVDPVPATRATAAQAFGSLVEKLGEDNFGELLPSLLSVLKSDVTGVDRQGAAQGISEILHGLGVERLEEMLPTILMNMSSSKSYIREGFMSLLVFLPSSFGTSFGTYVGRVIQPILSGLADDVESIRGLALTAGRTIVKSFASRAVDLLLPELEQSLASASHRIRLSSVELVGDLLFQLAGISGQISETGESDEEIVETNRGALTQLGSQLGEERRDRILASLYICRQDTSGLVRAAALDVWKVLVHNTPRTVKDILPTLISVILKRLASPNNEIQTISARTLGEIVSKNADSVLRQLLPAIEKSRHTGDSDTKQGICLAVSEIMQSVNAESLSSHEGTLVNVISTGLADPDADVRDAATNAFDVLQQVFGTKAINHILPDLLGLLKDASTSENALAALRGIMSSRAGAIFPIIVPRLVAQPISPFNARALAAMSEAAVGQALNKRMKPIVTGLMESIISMKDSADVLELDKALQSIIGTVHDEESLNTMMALMLEIGKGDSWQKRVLSFDKFGSFLTETRIPFTDYAPDLVRMFIAAFDDNHNEVVKASMESLTSLTKSLKKDDLDDLVAATERAIRYVGVDGKELKAFTLPKGVNSVLPILLQGVMYGTSEQREVAANGLGHVISRTPAEQLKVYVTQIAGPLIRTLGERYNADVKAAILQTLHALLLKIPAHLKPFLPQLQRTFAKCLADQNSALLRSRAAAALGTLITIQTRVDPLVGELVIGAKSADEGVRVAMLQALFEVVSRAGGNMSDVSKLSVLAQVEEGIESGLCAKQVADVTGSLYGHLSTTEAQRLLKLHIMKTPPTVASTLALNAVLLKGNEVLSKLNAIQSIMQYTCAGLRSNESAISDNFAVAVGKLLLVGSEHNFDTTKVMMESLATAVSQPESGSNDTRRLALVVLSVVGRERYDAIRPHIDLLAPVVFSCVRSLIIPVKLAAERTFISLFDLTNGDKGFEVSDLTYPTDFKKYVTGLPASLGKSMSDYKNRVAMKIAAAQQEREGAGAVESDEDRAEVLSVGV